MQNRLTQTILKLKVKGSGVFFVLLFLVACDYTTETEKEISRLIEKHPSDTALIDLSILNNFKWDTVYYVWRTDPNLEMKLFKRRMTSNQHDCAYFVYKLKGEMVTLDMNSQDSERPIGHVFIWGNDSLDRGGYMVLNPNDFICRGYVQSRNPNYYALNVAHK